MGKPVFVPRNLSALAPLCATAEHARFGATTGIQIEQTATGYKACATDGRVLGVVEGNEPDGAYRHVETKDEFTGETKRENLPIISEDRYASLPNSATKAVICSDQLVAALRAPAKNRRDQSPVALILSEKDSHAVSLHSVTHLENIEGRFPNYEQVFPTKKPRVAFMIDPGYFIDVLKAANAFTTDEARGVKVTVYDENTPIRVDVTSNPEQRFTGLIVPLSSKVPAPEVDRFGRLLAAFRRIQARQSRDKHADAWHKECVKASEELMAVKAELLEVKKDLESFENDAAKERELRQAAQEQRDGFKEALAETRESLVRAQTALRGIMDLTYQWRDMQGIAGNVYRLAEGPAAAAMEV